MFREEVNELQKATPRELRKFGLTVGGVFCALGLLFYLRHKTWWPWFVVPGLPLSLLGALMPRCLKWIYVAWMALAMLMGAVVSTILLTLLFYLVVTPVGWVARLAGKDFLRQKPEPAAKSHWIPRNRSKPHSKHEHEQQF